MYEAIEIADNYSIFTFVSLGRKGEFIKRIEFMPMANMDYYNLAFGDLDKSGNLDDYSISDNGDRNKILATVAFVVDIYLARFPDRVIYFKGSTPGRMRLYRITVGLNLDELKQNFEILGELNNEFVRFEKDMPVTGFLVQRKIFNLKL